jgi:hypothetical protein
MSTYRFLLILTLIEILSRRQFFIIISPFGKLVNRLFLFADIVLSRTIIVAWVGASIAKSSLSLNGQDCINIDGIMRVDLGNPNCAVSLKNQSILVISVYQYTFEFLLRQQTSSEAASQIG